MKATQSYSPRTVKRNMDNTAMLSRQFADGIIGKYGFWRNDYLGRLTLTFRELAAGTGESGDANEAEWRQTVARLQMQLDQLRRSNTGHVVTRSETIHRLEKWIRQYSGMTEVHKSLSPVQPASAKASGIAAGGQGNLQAKDVRRKQTDIQANGPIANKASELPGPITEQNRPVHRHDENNKLKGTRKQKDSGSSEGSPQERLVNRQGRRSKRKPPVEANPQQDAGGFRNNTVTPKAEPSSKGIETGRLTATGSLSWSSDRPQSGRLAQVPNRGLSTAAKQADSGVALGRAYRKPGNKANFGFTAAMNGYKPRTGGLVSANPDPIRVRRSGSRMAINDSPATEEATNLGRKLQKERSFYDTTFQRQLAYLQPFQNGRQLIETKAMQLQAKRNTVANKEIEDQAREQANEEPGSVTRSNEGKRNVKPGKKQQTAAEHESRIIDWARPAIEQSHINLEHNAESAESYRQAEAEPSQGSRAGSNQLPAKPAPVPSGRLEYNRQWAGRMSAMYEDVAANQRSRLAPQIHRKSDGQGYALRDSGRLNSPLVSGSRGLIRQKPVDTKAAESRQDQQDRSAKPLPAPNKAGTYRELLIERRKQSGKKYSGDQVETGDPGLSGMSHSGPYPAVQLERQGETGSAGIRSSIPDSAAESSSIVKPRNGWTDGNAAAASPLNGLQVIERRSPRNDASKGMDTLSLLAGQRAAQSRRLTGPVADRVEASAYSPLSLMLLRTWQPSAALTQANPPLGLGRRDERGAGHTRAGERTRAARYAAQGTPAADDAAAGPGPRTARAGEDAAQPASGDGSGLSAAAGGAGRRRKSADREALQPRQTAGLQRRRAAEGHQPASLGQPLQQRAAEQGMAAALLRTAARGTAAVQRPPGQLAMERARFAAERVMANASPKRGGYAAGSGRTMLQRSAEAARSRFQTELRDDAASNVVSDAADWKPVIRERRRASSAGRSGIDRQNEFYFTLNSYRMQSHSVTGSSSLPEQGPDAAGSTGNRAARTNGLLQPQAAARTPGMVSTAAPLAQNAAAARIQRAAELLQQSSSSQNPAQPGGVVPSGPSLNMLRAAESMEAGTARKSRVPVKPAKGAGQAGLVHTAATIGRRADTGERAAAGLTVGRLQGKLIESPPANPVRATIQRRLFREPGRLGQTYFSALAFTPKLLSSVRPEAGGLTESSGKGFPVISRPGAGPAAASRAAGKDIEVNRERFPRGTTAATGGKAAFPSAFGPVHRRAVDVAAGLQADGGRRPIGLPIAGPFRLQAAATRQSGQAQAELSPQNVLRSPDKAAAPATASLLPVAQTNDDYRAPGVLSKRLIQNDRQQEGRQRAVLRRQPQAGKQRASSLLNRPTDDPRTTGQWSRQAGTPNTLQQMQQQTAAPFQIAQRNLGAGNMLLSPVHLRRQAAEQAPSALLNLHAGIQRTSTAFNRPTGIIRRRATHQRFTGAPNGPAIAAFEGSSSRLAATSHSRGGIARIQQARQPGSRDWSMLQTGGLSAFGIAPQAASATLHPSAAHGSLATVLRKPLADKAAGLDEMRFDNLPAGAKASVQWKADERTAEEVADQVLRHSTEAARTAAGSATVSAASAATASASLQTQQRVLRSATGAPLQRASAGRTGAAGLIAARGAPPRQQAPGASVQPGVTQAGGRTGTRAPVPQLHRTPALGGAGLLEGRAALPARLQSPAAAAGGIRSIADPVIMTKPMTGAAAGAEPLAHLNPPAALQPQPSPALEYKLPEDRDSYRDPSEPPSLEVLRPQRAAEPVQEQPAADPQPVVPSELSKEQIQELIKQIPQLDVNKIADKVARELERRMRFDMQRRGM